jgi:hypothetical protein
MGRAARFTAGTCLIVVLVAAGGSEAPAQTPFTAIGFGYPTDPVDARASALGQASVALLGGTYSLVNPAAITELRGLQLNVSATGEAVSVKFPQFSEGINRGWMPVMRGIIPIGRNNVLALGVGSNLDQDWGVVFRDTIESSLGTFPFDERRENDGGLSSLDVTLARRLGALSLGVGLQRLTGNLRQTVFRTFERGVGGGPTPLPVRDFAQVSYAAWRFLGGLTWKLKERLMIGGQVALNTDLDATRDTTGVTVSFDQPLELGVGGSARLSSRLLLALSGGWTNWSVSNRSFTTVRAADTYNVGGGFEYSGLSLLALDVPLRLGFHWTELPFIIMGKKQSTEWAATFGFGTQIASGVAAFDFGFEWGQRGDLRTTGAEESFFRSTMSISLRQ